MKKIFTFLLALLLLFSVTASADNSDYLKWRKRFINLSADELQSAAQALVSVFSFDDIVSLKSNIDRVLFEMDDFQQVVVPEGIYTVGKDIPAGDWNIISVSGEQSTVSYFEKLNEYKTSYDESGYYWWDRVCNFPDYEVKSIHLELREGMYIRISLAPVVFSTYTGPSFTFN